MLKKVLFICVLCVIISTVVGCNDGEQSSYSTSVSESTISTYSSTENNDGSSVSSETEQAISFLGLKGETLHQNELNAELQEIFYYTYPGWAYMIPSDGNAKNSIDDVEEFDSDCRRFDGFQIQSGDNDEYSVIKEGDSLNGLTLNKAETILRYDPQKNTDGIAELARVTMEFSGELTLEGWIHVTEEEEGYNAFGDITFLVSDTQWYGMPYEYSFWTDFVFSWEANAPQLKLGNVNDYDIDIQGIVDGSTMTPVSVTLSDISLCFTHWGQLGYKASTAHIMDIEPIM